MQMTTKPVRSLVLLGVVSAWILGTGAGCDDLPPPARCTALLDYLQACAPTCPAPRCDSRGSESQSQSESDVMHLDELDDAALADFDACLQCLSEEAEKGHCTDCQIPDRAQTCRQWLTTVTQSDCLDF